MSTIDSSVLPRPTQRSRHHPRGGDTFTFTLSAPNPVPGDPREAAKLSQPTPQDFSNDRHDIYESTPPLPQLPQQQHRQQQRRQHQHQHRPAGTRTPDIAPDRTASPASSQVRSLRRTPRFDKSPSPSPRRIHVEAASAGFSPRVTFATAGAPEPQLPIAQPASPQPRPRPARPSRHERVLSQDLSDDLDEDDSVQGGAVYRHSNSPVSARPQQSSDLHPALRISRNTHGAILFALEEALRYPNPFTADLDEESAPMADLMRGGSGLPPSTSNGNGASTPRTRPTAAPAPTSSPSGIRGPRMIMQERAAREARQRAEQEQMQLERQRAEQEARRLEELQRRGSDRRAPPSATAAITSGPPEHIPIPQPDPATPQQQRRQAQSDARAEQRQSTAARRQEFVGSQSQSRPSRTSAAQAQAQPQTPTTALPAASQPQAGAAPKTETASASAGATRSSVPRNSFPHAFERWETLSAHWEGLTNFWIRRLEQNNEAIDRDPINQSLSRQVTDLSAAGANLFHAVVELQRLRASSERKFQRWFFETRAELERSQEVTAMLETALNEERRARAQAIQEAVDKERANSMNKTRFEELRKELQISKEEARRAWEELGRREQEERERTLSLQTGQPTIVGGVQVVPMTQGVPSRGASARQGGYQAEYGAPEPAYAADYSQAPASQSPAAQAPVTTDGGYYTQHSTAQGHEPTGSEADYVEGEYLTDLQGNYVRDHRGNKVPFQAPPSPVSDEGPDVFETPATNPPSAGYAQPAVTSPGAVSGGQQHQSPQRQAAHPQQQPQTQQQQPQYYTQPQDYTGDGYGAPAWEATVPRHHHPTRLSDVIEEDDERSRTSAGRSHV